MTLSFKSYLIQEKHQLTHLTHIEDLIFLKGHKGGLEIIKYLEGIIQQVEGSGSKGGTKDHNFTIKIDGAPSLIAGWSPEDQRFFVATKAFFNNNPKINYTPEDIDKNHGHSQGLSKKLKEALKYLPKVVTKGSIIQGDFIFSKDDLQYETIDGVQGVSFMPNAIKYHVDKNSAAYDQIKKAQIGIIFHTTYSGNTLDSLQGSFKISSSDFKSTTDVYAKDVNIKNDRIQWTAEERKTLQADIQELKKAIEKLNPKGISSLDKIAGTDVSREIMTFINTKVRSGTTFTRSIIRDLIGYIITKYDGRMIGVQKKFKTQKTIDKKTQDLKTQKAKLVKALQDMASELFYLLQWYYNVQEIKRIIVHKMHQIEGEYKEYNQKSDGSFEVTDPEGWVVSATSDSGVKLVNRSIFSANNFAMADRRFK
jgi:prefoldin subunit 5